MSIFPTDILYFVPEVKYNSLVHQDSQQENFEG